MSKPRFAAIAACSIVLSPAAGAAAIAAPQGQFRALNTVAGDVAPHCSADLNQDGREDLVGGIPAYWMRSEASGRLSAPRPLSPNAEKVLAEPVDADGDGDLDILTAGGSITQLFLLENDGDGNFESLALPVIFDLDRDNAAFQDVTGDGLPDIVVITGMAIDVYPAQGNGLYNVRVTTPYPNGPVVLRDVADQNGDGRLDLLLSSTQPAGDDVSWSLSDGLGGLGPGLNVASGVPAVQSALAGDIGGAGAVDVMIGSPTSLTWYQRDALLGYVGPNAVGNAGQSTGLRLADVTGNQALDVLYASPSTGVGFGFLANDGAGNFTFGQGFLNPRSDGAATFLLDIDADGDQDLIIPSVGPFGEGDIHVAYASSQGSFTQPQSIMEPIGFPRRMRSLHGDVNGDGATDLVVEDQFGSVMGLKWLEGAGNGEFSGTRTLDITALQVGSRGFGAMVADFNGDGFDDVAAADYPLPSASADIRIFFGSPAGLDQSQMVGRIPNGAGLHRSDFLDVDQDGDMDIVCLGVSLAWLENDGQGVFSGPNVITPSPISGNTTAPPVRAMDFDSDGIQDLIVQGGNIFAGTFRAEIFRGLPGGTFGPPVDVSLSLSNSASLTILLGDIDNDGDVDLVYQDSFGTQNMLYLRENLGGLQFAPGSLLLNAPLGAPPVTIQLVDWDLDGDSDLVFPTMAPATPPFSATVAWSENVGGLTFAPTEVLAVTNWPVEGMTFTDLDSDLDLDIVAFGDAAFAISGLDNERSVGGPYCSSTPNSSGAVASLLATGSAVASLNTLQLNASSMPRNVFGFFLGATAPALVPGAGGSAGVLCLGGQIGRYSRPLEVLSSGASGSFSLALDVTALRTPTGSTPGVAGQTWYFQAWFRDADPAPTSNFTSGLSVTLQ